MTQRFDGGAELEQLSTWLGTQEGLRTAFSWVGPVAGWNVRRLVLTPTSGQCMVEIWDDDGDVRAVFDSRFEMTFDSSDQVGWKKLKEALLVVGEGGVVLRRRLPTLGWQIVAAGSRYLPGGRQYAPYVE